MDGSGSVGIAGRRWMIEQRLTKRGKHGTAFAVIAGSTVQRIVFQRREYQDKLILDKHDLGTVYDRLAAYEDTGLTPEEVRALISEQGEE